MRKISRKDLRRGRRGAAMAVAMAMFILVSLGGTALLATNYQYNMQLLSTGIDMRLYNAAEAGAETVRGRFKLVAGTQEDWSNLLDSGDPLNVWFNLTPTPLKINGASVTVSSKAITIGAVPRARIRSIATIAGRQRAVEIDIQIASFSDYALFYNMTGGLSLAANFKCWGNLYCNSDIECQDNTGIEIFKNATTVGTMTGLAGNPQVYGTLTENAESIDIPSDAVGLGTPKAQAQGGNGYVFYQNTFEIVFNGTTFTRRYYKKIASTGTGNWPTNNLYNQDTGAVLSTGSGNSYYTVATETLPIPNDGVIYIDSDPASAGGATLLGGVYYAVDSDVHTSNQSNSTNHWEQPDQEGSSWDMDSHNKNEGDSNYDTEYQNRPCVLVKGTISDRRVTLVAEGNVIISDCIAYQSLLTTPSLRLEANKESAAALAITEMLGVLCDSRVHLATRWWNPLPPSAEVSPGQNNQFCTDGSFYGRDRVRIKPGTNYGTSPNSLGNSWSNSEYWVCGGLLNGGDQQSGMGNFTVRHYDWDARLAFTTPPFFLRAYNTPATRISRTWRTYKP